MKKQLIKILLINIIAVLSLACISPLIAYAIAPEPDVYVTGSVGYEKVWLNSQHGRAKIYYPPRVIVEGQEDSSTLLPVFVMSSKEQYFGFLPPNYIIWYSNVFSTASWKVYVKWDYRDMTEDDLPHISIASASLGGQGEYAVSFSVSAGTGPISGSISINKEGPLTYLDDSKQVTTIGDAEGRWLRLGKAWVVWDTNLGSVIQNGYYLLAYDNSYMDDYVGTAHRLYSYNKITLTWNIYVYTFWGWIYVGQYTSSYRFIIGDDIPSPTDTNWYVAQGEIYGNS